MISFLTCNQYYHPSRNCPRTCTCSLTLPLALKGDARSWFDSLFPEVKLRMNESLEEWFRHLRSRFQKDASAALQEGDNLRHSFDNESTVTVRQYMTQKQSLYLEAGE